MQNTLGRVLGETDKGTLAVIPYSSKNVVFWDISFYKLPLWTCSVLNFVQTCDFFWGSPPLGTKVCVR